MDGIISPGKGLHLDVVKYRPSPNSLSAADIELIKVATELT